MNHTITNGNLTVTASQRGGEIQSIRAKDGTEFFWNANPDIWPKHGPNLFPYLANLTEGKYTLDGQVYEMGLHGFVPYSELEAENTRPEEMTFRLRSCPATRACYPFEFTYEVTYRLDGNRLTVTYTVENRDKKTMYFGIGGHPGFAVPMEPGLSYEDYVLTFGGAQDAARVTFSGRGGVTGQTPYPISPAGIPLRHTLFTDGAIVLKNAGHQLTLSSAKSAKAVTVSFPQMPYVGIWGKPQDNAAFLCIEPWSSLPSRDGIVEDLAHQDNLVSLAPGKTYVNTWTVDFQF